MFGGTGGDGGFGGGGPGGPTAGGGVGGVGIGGTNSGGFRSRSSLYDKKYVLNRKGTYNAKAPQSWLQDLRDYLAGRSIDLDLILNWAETQTSEIADVPNQGVGEFPMFDQIPVEPKELSSSFGCSWDR